MSDLGFLKFILCRLIGRSKVLKNLLLHGGVLFETNFWVPSRLARIDIRRLRVQLQEYLVSVGANQCLLLAIRPSLFLPRALLKVLKDHIRYSL